jgi:hypothetical protein
VLVDVDETLYPRNSTEDFIDCAWRGLLALLLMRLLDVLKPWRLSGGTDTRETWRADAVAIFFPWTHRRWHAKVRSLAERYVNLDLKTSLNARAPPPVILTSGSKPIVAPLLPRWASRLRLWSRQACARSPTGVTGSCARRHASLAPTPWLPALP